MQDIIADESISGGMATFLKQLQLKNAWYLISVMFFGISTETMDLQLANMLSGIKEVMRDGTLKLVKMQP